jgi:beta-lactamase regulating signal transducer with metallopeptidase domain/type II secretory pathway component GspD/PulD (secretin)
MNSLIENLNQFGGHFLHFAWPMLWQSSLLIAFLFALDFLLARKIRASVRYALWLAVLVKLLLPPTLALPTGATWWLVHALPVVKAPAIRNYTVTYDTTPQTAFIPNTVTLPPPPPPQLNGAGWALLATGFVSAGLLLWLTIRWRQVARTVRGATAVEDFLEPLNEALRLAGAPASGTANFKNKDQHAGPKTGAPMLRPPMRLKLVEGRMSPAVCGLFRPVILLPRSLAEKLSPAQMRAVLLHEVFHLRRKDVWVNCAQALLQIVYWWHPLLWIANARIRRVREEAVDDAVMLALRDEADSYAPTLLEVAKLAFRRPLMSLGLVGIMESRSALRQRIERLVDFRAPRKAGLTFASLCGICVFSAVALPMGEAPALTDKSTQIEAPAVEQQSLTLKVNPKNFIQNIQSLAAKSILEPTNDYTAVLLDILRTEDVDCVPPNGIAFNTKTGEITTQNTSDKLEIFRQVIEQLNRTDGKCELPLHNNFHRKSVLIEAHIYQMPATDFGKYVSGFKLYKGSQGNDPWWSVTPEEFKQLVGALKSSGLKLIQRPRIQTGSGMAAEFYVGDQTNSLDLACKPFAADGFVELTLQGTFISGAPADAFTNHFSAQAAVETNGGIVLQTENYGGHAGDNLIVVISAEVVTNDPPYGTKQRLVAVVNRAGSPTNITGVVFDPNFRVVAHALQQRTGTETLSEPEVVTTSGRGINRMTTTTISAPVSKVDSGRLVQEDKLFSEMGKLDDMPAPSDPEKAGAAIYSRHFRVSTNLFTAAWRKAAGMQTNYVSQMATSYFGSLGVDLHLPGKSIFYNDGMGELFVRATQADLDKVENAVERLNADSVPIQVHIKARFMEVPKGTLQGFKTRFTAIPQPGQTNQLAVLTGILTSENFRTVWQNLENQPGVEDLAEPEVVTIGGRQTQMRATVIQTIITNFVFQETSTNSAVMPQAGSIETGPVLDVVPNVLSDGYTINLTLIPSLMEFLGYDNPTNTTPVHNSEGEEIDLPQVLPKFRIRQGVANANLWDGQTLVIGGMSATNIITTKDSVPLLGDLPLMGRLFRSESKSVTMNELLVFVTATLVDPAGNRVHTDDELPFAKDKIPPQPPPLK